VAPAPDPAVLVRASGGHGPVVLRMRHDVYFGLAFTLAAGLAWFLAVRHQLWLAAMCGVLGLTGLGGSLQSVPLEIDVRGGWLTVRGLPSASRPVDLHQLETVLVPDRNERWLPGRRYLLLRDRRRAEVRLTLNGTLPSQRSPLLAALEPWIMADGVTRVGPVHDALSGRLWWPHRRRGSELGKADDQIVPG
jgi:hypothetical protein